MGGYVRMMLTVYMSKAEMSRGLLKRLDIFYTEKKNGFSIDITICTSKSANCSKR